MIARTLCFSVFAIAIAVPAESPAPSPGQLIANVQKRVFANFQRPANCLCRETIQPAQGGPIRVEVALIDGREQYSWPGSKKYDDAALNALIKASVVGTGAYSIHPRNLFLKTGAKFEYKGETALDERKVHRFDFVLPADKSAFTLTDGQKKYIVGYHGSVWADRKSFDLVRLELAVDDIPAALKITASEDRIDYHQVMLGDEAFTLPQTMERKVTTKNGEFRNISRFEACHPFTADLVAGLVNDESADDQEEKKPVEQEVVRPAPARPRPAAQPAKPAVPAPVAHVPKPNVEVEAGLRLEMELTSSILSEAGARVGDPVTAVLTDALASRTKTFFPKGAQLTGNVLVIEKHTSEYFDFYVAGVRFDWIVDGSSRAIFSAVLEQVPIATEGYIFLPYYHLATQEKTAWNGIFLSLNPPKYNEGVFWKRGSTLVVPAGMRMVWRTTRPKKE